MERVGSSAIPFPSCWFSPSLASLFNFLYLYRYSFDSSFILDSCTVALFSKLTQAPVPVPVQYNTGITPNFRQNVFFSLPLPLCPLGMVSPAPWECTIKPQQIRGSQPTKKGRYSALQLARSHAPHRNPKFGFIRGPLKSRFRGLYLAKSAHKLSQERPTTPFIDLA